MKGSFSAPAGTLAAAVRYAARWLDPRPSVPAHAGLLFSVADGQLTITGFNENATARASLPIDGDGAGSFLVAGRLVDALVATLPDRPVMFEQNDSCITMSAGRYRATLPAMSESDYPTMPAVAPTVGRIEGAALIDAVRRVGTAASGDTTPGVIFTGLHLSVSGDVLTLTGTDRRQATREAVPADFGGISREKKLVVPASVMVDAGDAFSGLEPVEIGWDQGRFSLATPSRSLVTRTLGKPDEFPDMTPMFAQIEQRTHTATIAVKDLLIPLKRADQLADSEYRHVAIDLRADTLILRSSTDGKGDGGEEVDIRYDGPDCTITTRSAFLHGVLTSAPGDTVVLHITPRSYVSVFATSTANPAWTHLFMPIRHA